MRNVKPQSLAQLHSLRVRRGGAMPFGRRGWPPRALATNASATDAESIPTNRNASSGGLLGTREGSIPSSAAAHMNNDTVVQGRSAGWRRHARPAPPSPL